MHCSPVLKVGTLHTNPPPSPSPPPPPFSSVVPRGLCMARGSLRSHSTTEPSSPPAKAREALCGLKQQHFTGDWHVSVLKRKGTQEGGVFRVASVACMLHVVTYITYHRACPRNATCIPHASHMHVPGMSHARPRHVTICVSGMSHKVSGILHPRTCLVEMCL